VTDIVFTEEQDELRRTVRAFLEQKSPEAEVRRLMETADGYDPAVWGQMAEQLGLQGLAIPEAYGGSGYSFVELGIVLEEMGRSLLCAPFLSSVVLAANTLLRSGDEAAMGEWLPGIADGSVIGSLAYLEDSGRADESGITAGASPMGDGWAITGTKSYVIDGHIADLVLVAARTAAGVSLFAVRGDALGLARTRMQTLDLTRTQARLELDGVPATLVGADGQGWALLTEVFDLAVTGLAAEQAGGSQRVLDMAVAYASERVQFGRIIGSFQAIKHKCADMLTEVELAKTAAYNAMWTAAEVPRELPEAAAIARSFCSEAYVSVASENIQIHGGMGFTYEHPAHLYLRRATSSELLFGVPSAWRERLAELVGM
jgi:alkylation response protein AidB-like acyl-CoA dehydrogenase